MKKHTTLLSTTLAVALGLSMTAANAVEGFGVSSGDITKNSYGQCWTSGSNSMDNLDENGCPILDADGDGVNDDMDRCPGTPAGAKVDAKGCELDDDKDGVANSADKCPGTAYGIAVYKNGCMIDKDGDGVAWSLDACKGTPAGVTVDAHGCAAGAVEIHFATDSAALNAAAQDAAAQAAAAMKGANISVVGHTDSTGDEAYNQALSERRAAAVAEALKANGISMDNISISGAGESQPVADNGTAAGRAANRRAEISVK